MKTIRKYRFAYWWVTELREGREVLDTHLYITKWGAERRLRKWRRRPDVQDSVISS